MTSEKITSIEEAVVLSEIAASAGSLMLANGAEIYRVEDTVERIIRSKESIKDVDVFSSYNTIIITFSYRGEIHTNMRRVRSRGNTLYYVDRVNTFSRNFSAGLYTLDEALIEIDKIKKEEPIPTYLKILGATIAAGSYSILLGGNLIEVLFSFLVGYIAYRFSLFLERNNLNFFVVNFLYGFVLSLLALLINEITPISINIIIVGGMMAFVPGVMLTNAVRDLMSGDALSGITGTSMAILISIALAVGVATPISIWRLF